MRYFIISMTLEAIKYDPQQARLEILNQLLLPHQTVYEQINSVEDAWHAIRDMKVGRRLLECARTYNADICRSLPKRVSFCLTVCAYGEHKKPMVNAMGYFVE